MDGAAQAVYGQVPSPIGELMAVVTRRGLVALAFDSEPHDQVLNAVAKKVSPAIIDLPSAISDIRHQLDAYFTGSLRFFDIPLDRALLTPFQDKVLAATSAIPFWRGENLWSDRRCGRSSEGCRGPPARRWGRTRSPL